MWPRSQAEGRGPAWPVLPRCSCRCPPAPSIISSDSCTMRTPMHCRRAGDNMAEQDYELFAIRYATRDARRAEHFIGGDPHDGPMPMDYFIWVAKGGGRTFIIDTGFTADTAK